MGPGRVPVEPRPAASVMVFRSTPQGPVVLYLRRNPDLAFHGGYWVFPGGRIDPADRDTDNPHDDMAAARRAAVRESDEEAGLDLAVDDLVFAVHWTTPLASPIRFSTWFFVAETMDEEVRIDGQEIHDSRWIRPADALEEQAASTIKLAGGCVAHIRIDHQTRGMSGCAVGVGRRSWMARRVAPRSLVRRRRGVCRDLRTGRGA